MKCAPSRRGYATRAPPERIAAGLADASRIIVIGSGADRPAGREITLKIEEASWLPTAYRDLETFLHGHLPATDSTTGLILVLADRDHRSERLDRARQALAERACPRSSNSPAPVDSAMPLSPWPWPERCSSAHPSSKRAGE